MRVSRAWLVAPALALALAACSDSGSTSAPDNDTTATTTATPDTKGSPSAIPSPGLQVVPGPNPSAIPTPAKEPQGANAAPGEVIYDGSQTAINLFWMWWTYEAVLPEDWTRDSQTVLTDGISVCASLAAGAGHDAVITVLERERNYRPAGATAVYAAAVRSICAHRNPVTITDYEIGGYNTSFDKNVAQARAQILTQVTYPAGMAQPKIFDFGFFAKYACHYLATYKTANGLMEYLVANSGQLYMANPAAHDERVREIYVIELTKTVCYGSTPVWNEDWYR